MLRIPTKLLAATLSGDGNSPETTRQRAVEWMQAIIRPIRDVAVALEAIAWAEELPRIEKVLASEDRLALGDFLSSLPADADPQTIKDQPLLHQLLTGELAWTLATRLPETPASRRLEKSGRAAISQGLSQILDRQGMLPAEHIHRLRPLLACWTRCRALAAKLPGGGWGPRPEQRYQRLVRNALRCARPDGRPLLAGEDSDSGKGTWGRELFEAVLKSGVEEIDRSLAAVSLPSLPSGVVAKPPKKAADLPPASIHSEDRAIAVLRRNWSRDDERIAVLFDGPKCRIELIASGRVAASGVWQFEVAQQGRQLPPVSNWESTCWYTDEDVDYLELEIELEGGVKLQRQIVLAREDRFLLLADAVMSPQPGGLDYRGVLPLAPQIAFREAAESREGLLTQAGIGKSASPVRWPRSCRSQCRSGARSNLWEI